MSIFTLLTNILSMTLWSTIIVSRSTVVIPIRVNVVPPPFCWRSVWSLVQGSIQLRSHYDTGVSVTASLESFWKSHHFPVNIFTIFLIFLQSVSSMILGITLMVNLNMISPTLVPMMKFCKVFKYYSYLLDSLTYIDKGLKILSQIAYVLVVLRLNLVKLISYSWCIILLQQLVDLFYPYPNMCLILGSLCPRWDSLTYR